MFFQSKLLLTVAAAGLAGFIGLVATGPASALSMQECSAKYKAAKADGSLGGQSWNDFRKTKCGTDDTAATSAKSAAKPAASAATAAAGGAVFPTAVNPKYASETPGKARMHTCVDQFNANKGKNANGGMKWIQKGGGYYSACNKRLKGG